ncbi:MAG TPA: carboxypeptidase-like regulatory domain-containing protein [Terriglobales bacterium]|nr:carboxypeptidase-like regulatory domain-containing protein [Terriglobales bacterium]
MIDLAHAGMFLILKAYRIQLLWSENCTFANRPVSHQVQKKNSAFASGGKMEVDFRRKFAIALLISAVLFASSALFAQSSPNGRLAGSVTDPTGAAIKDAQITVTSDATGATYNAKSSGEGAFFIPDLPFGLYTVQVEANGFTKSAYKQVKIDAGQEYSLAAVLKVGAATETVEVTAGAELVSTTKTEVSNTINSQQVLNLPLN